MPLLIKFPVPEDRLRAIDILAEAEVTYSGVGQGCYMISAAAAALLQNRGIDFCVVAKQDPTRRDAEQLAAQIDWKKVPITPPPQSWFDDNDNPFEAAN
jgi:hypothetical protein